MLAPYLRADIARLWQDADPLVQAKGLTGEVFREVAQRRTLKVQLGDREYFLKLHLGVGWGEIFKNLITLRVPVVGARNEYLACEHLAAHNITAPKVAAFAEVGRNPAQRESFVLCDALVDRLSLEDLSLDWHNQPPPPELTRALVMAVADFAAKFHGAGLIHRDFYICHLLVTTRSWEAGQPDLAVLDLHRAKLFQTIPKTWLKRDLAALLFSVLDLPLSRFAWLRFVRRYTGKPLRDVFRDDGQFWQAVYDRAVKLYAKSQRKGLTTGYFQP